MQDISMKQLRVIKSEYRINMRFYVNREIIRNGIVKYHLMFEKLY